MATINAQGGEPLPRDLLNDTTQAGPSLVRALYYPAQKAISPVDAPVYWAAPHTDIDYLAILSSATAKGLQVEVNGEWVNVVVPEDTFIINVGDML